MKLQRLRVVVTGAAGNLGASLCDHLCAGGAEVIGLDLADDFSREAEREVKNHFRYYQCDLTNEEAASRIFAQIEDIDVLVNMAGVLHSRLTFSPFEDPKRLSLDEWQRVVDANLRTAFLAGSLAIEQMVMKRKRGLLINIGSVMAYGEVGQSAYAAAKAGVQAMSLVWAKELGPLGIRSLAIAPGFFDSESTNAAMSASKREEVQSEVPIKRLGGVAELNDCVAMVIENDYLNGTILTLDGGFSLR